MSEANLTHWSFGGETPGTRNHFHETALREARIATEYRERAAHAAPTQPGLLARVRKALAGPFAAPDACNCPA